jgi:triacylglycerol lipase
MTRTKADSFQTLQYVPMTIERRPSKHVQKHTIILAHGLLGFDELRLAGHYFPGLHYWRGITEALSHNGIEVIVAAVPASGSIEARAAKLAESIAQKAKGKQVNIIAYVELSMRS